MVGIYKFTFEMSNVHIFIIPISSYGLVMLNFLYCMFLMHFNTVSNTNTSRSLLHKET